MEKINKTKKFYSDKWYRDIETVTFEPLKEIGDIKLYRKGGQHYWWKLFGFIPIWQWYCEEDLYSLPQYITEHYTEKECVAKYYNRIVFVGNKAFDKAVVTIVRKGSNNRYEYFDNNEDALAFVEEVNEKAKKVKNTIS